MAESNTTTLAVRYRYVLKHYSAGVKVLPFLPHKVNEVKHDQVEFIDDLEYLRSLDPKDWKLQDHNRVLGIPTLRFDASEETIRSAYRPKVLHHHLDKRQAKGADIKVKHDYFTCITMAYETLGDPKKRKSHYRVLGIPTLRFNVSEETIRSAYRQKVLYHHPDKRKAKGADIKVKHDYFTCITMAYETLGDPKRGKSYDSVDPEFDNGLPSSHEIKNDFYGTCAYYFELSGRWSEQKNMPKIGGSGSTIEEVENFYNFWYDFKSWREFSYEDLENKDACSGREGKRHADKLNKAERARKKKEEIMKLRTLVDLAYKNDPRIFQFKQEEKDRKLEAKKAKEAVLQKRIENEQKAAKEAKLAMGKAEAEGKARIEAERKKREMQKNALKKERKTLRDICKSNNYFVENPKQNLKYITAVETICETMNVEELKEVNEQMKNEGKTAFLRAAKLYYSTEKPESKTGKTQNITSNGTHQETEGWNGEKIKYLKEALKIMPQGTNRLWKKIADFMNKHDKLKKDCGKFTPKMVSIQAKKLQIGNVIVECPRQKG
ncbi:dnaJ homolog subfamily C member 2-like [Coccinella septempunctata]|uniref:dnaJ homolog subfamily C member 2-like n=1 Tax=Coccinella septempunctata TaxID=41139 RepID=UPI001D075D37|nr:dnaJ homolog subfamily C member 2-like [Coccinella septempunctata]